MVDYSNDWDGWIQAYFDGELKPEEIQVFEQQLADSPSFSTRFKEYQESVLQLKAVHLDRLSKDMREWVAQSPSAAKARIKPLIWLASAAMVILLVLAGSWLFLKSQYQGEAILASAMDYKVEARARLSGGEEGLLALENKEFAKAIAALPNWVDEDSQITAKAYLYLAKSHIGLNQFDSASYYLDLLAERHQTEPTAVLFWEEVPWYQALAALGAGDRNASLEKLEVVINNKGYHQTDAIALKAKLQSKWYPYFNQ